MDYNMYGQMSSFNLTGERKKRMRQIKADL